MIVTASQKNIPISPKKLARVVEVVKGHKAAFALDELKILDKKGAFYASKVLKSAMANAENNFKLDTTRLVISKIWVTDGTKSIKRFRFASRARVVTIQKYRSNLSIELSYGS